MFNQNDIVKYSAPLNEAEAALRFVVIEDRETRLLVGVVLDEEGMKKHPMGLTECFAIEHYTAA